MNRAALRVALVLLAAVCAALVAAMLVMGAPQADLELLAIFLVISGSVSLALGGAVIRWLGLRLNTMRGRLAVAATAGVLVAFVNVLATAVLMFLSPHDLALLVLLLGFAGVMSLTFGYVTAGRLTAELEQVSRTAERFADGELDARVHAKGRDEAARLGWAFDRMAERLQDAFERERALEASRRDLVAAVSHDLRTPLATTRAMVEAINDGVVTEPREINRYLMLIGREIQHLSGLIDDMFELSLIESGTLQLRLEVLSPRPLIDSVVSAYQTRAAGESIQLECAFSSSVDSTHIRADPERLQRVLRNLLDNALRYTPGGGLIRVDATVEDHVVTVGVDDSGPGIPAEQRESVFERSYRGPRTRHAEVPSGAGLGLTIARGLVSAHNGRIWAEASPLGGARLRFSLPAYY